MSPGRLPPDRGGRRPLLFTAPVSLPGVLLVLFGCSDHGMFVGPSSGAHVAVAQRLRQTRPELAIVVTVLCDKGEKYLSEIFQVEGGPGTVVTGRMEAE